MRGRLPTLLVIVYLCAGSAIAAERDYFHDLDHVKRIVSAILAVLLWPLLLLGISLRIH